MREKVILILKLALLAIMTAIVIMVSNCINKETGWMITVMVFGFFGFTPTIIGHYLFKNDDIPIEVPHAIINLIIMIVLFAIHIEANHPDHNSFNTIVLNIFGTIAWCFGVLLFLILTDPEDNWFDLD